MLENDVKSINSLTYLINKSNVVNSDGKWKNIVRMIAGCAN